MLKRHTAVPWMRFIPKLTDMMRFKHNEVNLRSHMKVNRFDLLASGRICCKFWQFSLILGNKITTFNTKISEFNIHNQLSDRKSHFRDSGGAWVLWDHPSPLFISTPKISFIQFCLPLMVNFLMRGFPLFTLKEFPDFQYFCHFPWPFSSAQKDMSYDIYVFLQMRLSYHTNGVFTLPDNETDTDTDKKWVIKNCVEVFTLHSHNHAIEYCYNLSVLVSVSVSGSVNAPLDSWNILKCYIFP